MNKHFVRTIGCLATAWAVVGCSHALNSGAITPSIPRTSLDAEPPRMVSAFFGLDNALPKIAGQFTPEAPGKDGLPVTFSRRVLGGPAVDPKVFTVRTRSGAVRHPVFATTAPASALGKGHTVLLIGELGNDPTDPPVSVEVTGDLPLEHGGNARGLSAPVIPLTDGPTLVLALSYKVGDFPCDTPAGARQVVVAIWAGGVKPKPGADQAAHLNGYRVTTSQGEVQPIALGGLNDNDNYVFLFLNTDAPVERVTFAPGIVVDPHADVNPATSVQVSRAK